MRVAWRGIDCATSTAPRSAGRGPLPLLAAAGRAARRLGRLPPRAHRWLEAEAAVVRLSRGLHASQWPWGTAAPPSTERACRLQAAALAAPAPPPLALAVRGALPPVLAGWLLLQLLVLLLPAAEAEGRRGSEAAASAGRSVGRRGRLSLPGPPEAAGPSAGGWEESPQLPPPLRRPVG
jgi:hypothetical protein